MQLLLFFVIIITIIRPSVYTLSIQLKLTWLKDKTLCEKVQFFNSILVSGEFQVR